MTDDEIFRQTRRIVSFWNFFLSLVEDIKIEHDSMVDKLGESLANLEDFCESKGISIEMCHLTNYANFLDEAKIKQIRKKILDHGNNLKREIESEK